MGGLAPGLPGTGAQRTRGLHGAERLREPAKQHLKPNEVI